jgi:hypothetical protein
MLEMATAKAQRIGPGFRFFRQGIKLPLSSSS